MNSVMVFCSPETHTSTNHDSRGTRDCFKWIASDSTRAIGTHARARRATEIAAMPPRAKKITDAFKAQKASAVAAHGKAKAQGTERCDDDVSKN